MSEHNRFARTDPFLDELDRIGYIAIPKTELAELDRLRAEVELMRPVIEAAREFTAVWSAPGMLDADDVVATGNALEAAVAALDAGEPAGE